MTGRTEDVAGLTPDEKRSRLAAALRRQLRGDATLPLSSGQRALWLLNRLAPGTAAYNIAFTARVVSPLDPEAFRRACQALVDRYPILRSVFPSEAGEPVRQVLDHVVVAFDAVDASTWSTADVYDDLRREIDRPFDLARGPVLRVRLLRCSAQESFLAFAVHHIVMDGWSLWLCLAELRDLYGAAVRGGEMRLPAPQADFTTYLRLQADALDGAEGGRHRRFWKGCLGQGTDVLSLPADRTRPPTPAFRGASHRFRLSPAVANDLRTLTRGVRGTLQMGVLALFEVLLHRYSGQGKVAVGYLASGRTRAALQSIVGYLANPLTLQARFDDDTTFRGVLQQARDTVLDALEHEDYPFSAVVDQVAPDRDPSRSPLFQALFVFEKPQLFEDQPVVSFVVGEAGARMMLGDLELESLPFAMQREGQFDLTLVAGEVDGGVSLAFDYNTELFEASTVARMAEHLQTLAEGAVAHPERPVATLPILSEQERALVARLRRTGDGAPGCCFHELFEAHALRQPDATAVIFEGAEMSYGELNRRANALAQHLRAVGVGPDTIVGISVNRSAELVVGVLAILKAGGAFLPLDPGYPEDRLAHMIADSRLTVLVTDPALVDRLPPFAGRLVALERTPVGAEESPSVQLSSRNLAYVIYTSGSTGRPKGVMLEHGGLVNVAREQQRLFGVGPGSRVLQFAALSFDASVFEVAMALGSGATLCLAAPAALLPGLPLLETIRALRINVVTLPPSALLNLPEADPPALETITVAGEACPAELVARWARGRSFFNLYGPTEATIWTTVARCDDGSRTPSIGQPIANVTVQVLDRRLEPVPIGIPGDLYIGGAGLARGYLHQPELTAERFVLDPFSDVPDARLYKTGDVVRLTASGDLEFLGRADHQVKVRGFRIELGEIEAVLAQHPDVNETAVLARGSTAADQRIVAYVVLHASATCSAATLKGFLRSRLPEFMVPASFVFMAGFPVSPSGKVDRQALPAFDRVEPCDEPRTALSGDLEERIAAIWRDVLHVDRVGADENFFDIGGTSLLIARVHARLSAIRPSGLSIVEMFQFPTIRSLAARLDAGEASPEHDDRGRAAEMAVGRARLRDQARRRSESAKAGTTE